MKFLTFAFLFFSVAGAWARIGDTPEQCEARYGEGETVSSNPATIVYHKGDFMITVAFSGNKAQTLLFQKQPVEADGRGTAMSGEEIRDFLLDNGDDTPWTLIDNQNYNAHWIAAKGRLMANYNSQQAFLFIGSKEGFEAEAAREGTAVAEPTAAPIPDLSPAP